MTKKRNYSPEFRLESAQLVVDQGYTLKAACEAMGVSKTTMEYWVRRLRAERAGKAPEKGEALTPEQREIQQLKRKLPVFFKIVVTIFASSCLFYLSLFFRIQRHRANWMAVSSRT